MCRVLNKHAAGGHHGAIYIGRGSKWGNPFRIGADGDRATVIAKHARWLRDQHHLLRARDELRGKDLLGFCAPVPCHGDLLLRLANATRLVALDGVTAARRRTSAQAGHWIPGPPIRGRRLRLRGRGGPGSAVTGWRSRERLAAPVAETRDVTFSRSRSYRS